jgi:Protein of unknown function (DUF1461)
MRRSMPVDIARTLPWFVFMALTLVAALFLSWRALIGFDYLYPVWYETLDIDQTIAQYGPQNRQGKLLFETTTKIERVRLFSALADAVHHQGRGLKDLVYQDSTGHPIATLLTAPEIVHLQDVARIFGWLQTVGWVALAALVVLLTWLRSGRQVLPSVRKLLLWTVSGIAIVGAVVVALGPTKLFYQLHEWIFPPGHQWFFFYQDSLMSTMMKAPVLFGPIALTWALLSLLVTTALLIGTKRLLRR